MQHRICMKEDGKLFDSDPVWEVFDLEGLQQQ